MKLLRNTKIYIPLDGFVGGKFEFHISRQSRNRYQFDQSIYQISGDALFINFQAAHDFAAKMNTQRDLVMFPEKGVRASAINAMGLIDEISHLVIAEYRTQVNELVMRDALSFLVKQVGQERLEMSLLAFADAFPPVDVYSGAQSITAYFEGETEGISNQEILLEEMVLLWLTNMNPACSPYVELFDDSLIETQTAYLEIISELQSFFIEQPGFKSGNQILIEMLRAPALASPDSLAGQMEYMMLEWDEIIGEELMRVLRGLDFIREEEMARFGAGGPGSVELPDFTEGGETPERFSEDKDWMPNLVLMAKNAYVWLDQLSNKYGREIVALNEIPDEELDLLASWGVTGLWLIGLWERSTASQTIKQRMGQPDAVASAYSLYDYAIANDLGGEFAMNELRGRAWQRGIRMGSDMVPNHMGMDSRWVIEHPDWFVSLPHSPFPSYTFNGPDLSRDEQVGVYLEDHYYDHSDAAVVFKRIDHRTGDARYIYHGNDGTSMPWNDTAQLNFLSEAVREGVIQTILHVARQFPIIRFDAAMTLAKKHIQRLWFPEPGLGGAIPSRAEHGLSKAEFDQLIPEEFWREVVDRVAQEAPDTLLLAEAFWMMEGYFVRTLGMHRVYNSAFMHMLRDEDNAKYRQLIKDTLEFNPQVLKRYVNFMNNPDEDTAVEQFGKGDKYFGVATLMATLPGLPMLGHGQVEGYAEKYGMEYRKAKWDETPDNDLLTRHQKQYFPLLHKRKLFAEVENFLLYDFYSAEGNVNENVFVFSNRLGDERGLVLYLNQFSEGHGWIKTSAAFIGEGDELVQTHLAEGLALPDDPDAHIIFQDQNSGLEYLRNCAEIHRDGLYFELHAYQTYVFIDFRIVYHTDNTPYGILLKQLRGQPASNIDHALRKIFLKEIHEPYRELINGEMLTYLYNSRVTTLSQGLSAEPLRQVETKIQKLISAINAQVSGNADGRIISAEARAYFVAILQLPILRTRYPLPRSRKYKQLDSWLQARLNDNLTDWGLLFTWVLTALLGRASNPVDYLAESQRFVEDLLLGDLIEEMLCDLQADSGQARTGVSIVKLLISHQNWFQMKSSKKARPLNVLKSWLVDHELRDYLGINQYGDVLWFNKEAFEDWLWWAMTATVIQCSADVELSDEELPIKLVEIYDVIRAFQRKLDASEYQVQKLMEALKGK